MAGLQDEFARRNCKIIGISVDGVSDHHAWKQDIASCTGHSVAYPLIGDPNLDGVKLYDMLPGDAGDTAAGRTPANWQQGGDVIISPSVSDEVARERFPDGWQQPLPYIRIVPQPK